MVRAWYFDSLPGDQREPHKGEDVSLDELSGIGVLYWKVRTLLEVASLPPLNTKGCSHRLNGRHGSSVEYKLLQDAGSRLWVIYLDNAEIAEAWDLPVVM